MRATLAETLFSPALAIQVLCRVTLKNSILNVKVILHQECLTYTITSTWLNLQALSSACCLGLHQSLPWSPLSGQISLCRVWAVCPPVPPPHAVIHVLYSSLFLLTCFLNLVYCTWYSFCISTYTCAILWMPQPYTLSFTYFLVPLEKP